MATPRDNDRSVNAVLMDRAIRHAVFLERLKTHEANLVLGFLNDEFLPDLQERIAGRLERIARIGFDTGPETTARLQNFEDFTLTLIAEATRKITSEQTDRLRALAKSESASIAGLVNRSVQPLLEDPGSFQFGVPPTAQLHKIVTATPFEGAVLKDWWESTGRAFGDDLNRQVRIGVVAGETTPQIARRLYGTARDAFGTGSAGKLRRNAEAVTRTAISHVSAQARQQTFEENADLTKGVMWLATLDTRTTPICRSLDGKVFPIDSGPRPPVHFGERSTITVLLKSAAELGIKLKSGKSGIVQGTRSSLDGTIPKTTTYGPWLRSQPREVQELVLGKWKAARFRSGELTIEQFVDDRGKELTIPELERLLASEN